MRSFRISSFLTLYQIERKRALGNPEAEPPAAKKRSMMAVFRSAFLADGEVVEYHGPWWGPVMRDSWGALPSSSVVGVDAAMSAWTAESRGETVGKNSHRERNVDLHHGRRLLKNAICCSGGI